MPERIQIHNSRMLQLMNWYLENHTGETESSYLGKIGFVRNNIGKVKTGVQGFTIQHIKNACKLTGASADWILGLSNSMSRKDTKDPLDRLREVLIELEAKSAKKLKGV